MFLFIRSVFFLLLYKIPLFVKKQKQKNIIFFSILLRMEIWVVSSLERKLLWTFLYVSLHLILLGIHQRVEILDDSVGMYPTLSKTAGVFPRGWKNLSSHEYKWEFYLLHNFSNTRNCQSFEKSVIHGVWWYLTVVLISIALVTDGAEHLFICLLTIWVRWLFKCLTILFVCLLVG